MVDESIQLGIRLEESEMLLCLKTLYWSVQSLPKTLPLDCDRTHEKKIHREFRKTKFKYCPILSKAISVQKCLKPLLSSEVITVI